MNKKIVSGIIGLVCVFFSSAFAQSLPDFPMSLWGTAKNGVTPLANGVVQVYNGATKVGEIVIINGQYGGNTVFDNKITLNSFTGGLSYKIITGGLTYNLASSNITKINSTGCPAVTNITFVSDVCQYDLNLDATAPTCDPTSVANGLVNSTTCDITCNSGYTLSGSTCTVMPSATPAASTYTSTQNVTLTAAGASSIRYTTDGTTTPTCSTGTLYSGAISVTTSTTIKAISCYPNSVASSVVNYVYTLSCATPTVANGSVSSYPACTITCNSGYSLSGSTCRAAASSGGGGGGGGGGGYTSPPKLPITDPEEDDIDDYVDDGIPGIVIMPPVKPLFSDITGSFASANIISFAERGILKGYADRTFRPNNPITRAEFLAVTMKALGITVPAASTSSFNDVTVAWMIPYVETAKSLGIAKGQTIGGVLKFRPNDSITRAEAIAILLSAAKITVDSSLATTQFTDITVAWMIPYVETARTMGIVNGQIINGLLKFRPNDSITRAESVKIITIASSL